jgi:hypothetical protein
VTLPEQIATELSIAAERGMRFLGRKESLSPSELTPYWFFVNKHESIRDFVASLALRADVFTNSFKDLATTLPVYLLSSPHVLLQFGDSYRDERNKEPEVYIETRWRQIREMDEAIVDPDVGQASVQFGPSRTLQDFTSIAKPLMRAGNLIILPRLNTSSAFSGFSLERQAEKFYNRCEPLEQLGNAIAPQTKAAMEAIMLPVLQNVQLDVMLKLAVDEWDAYTRCQRFFAEALRELQDATEADELGKRAPRIKRNLIDDGIDKVETRYRALKRKGLFDAISAYLGSGAIYFSSISHPTIHQEIAQTLGASALLTRALHTYFEVRGGRRDFKASSFYFLLRLTKRLQWKDH